MGAGVSAGASQSTLDSLQGAARDRAVTLSQKFGGGGSLPSSSAVSVHAAVELGARLAKHTHASVLKIYNQTYVGTGGLDMMSDGCLASRYAIELLEAHHLQDPRNPAVGLGLAEAQLRFGQLLGIMAQNNAFEPMVKEYYVLVPLGLSEKVETFVVGTRMLQSAQRLFETHAAAAPPLSIGACSAALGELYYCSGCASIHTDGHELGGMDGGAQTLESLRLSEEAIDLRKAAGLGATTETANIHKDLGKVFSFVEELLVGGTMLDAGQFGSADQCHAKAEAHLLRALEIHTLLGSSASTDANLMRLIKAAGVKCRETAEKRGLRVAERVEEIFAEHELAASVGETLGAALQKDKFIDQLACVLKQKTHRVVSNDLMAYGYLLSAGDHANHSVLERTIVETAMQILKPPISKEVWKAFSGGLLKSNIWFRSSTEEATKGALLYRTLLAGAAAEVSALESGLASSLEPFAEGIAELSEPGAFPCVDKILRHDELGGGNDPDFESEQLPNGESRQFYDMKVYLPKLILVARIVNTEFQAWVESNFGELGEVCPGPIKTLERAEAKAENDYADKAWPTSAHVIDLVRARLLVDTPEAMATVVHKALALCAAAPSSDGLLGLARIKNSFLLESKGFRDIKVSVAFESDSGVKMICELGVNLRVMHDYGRKAHVLYEIERERTFYEEVEHRLKGKEAKPGGGPQLE